MNDENEFETKEIEVTPVEETVVAKPKKAAKKVAPKPAVRLTMEQRLSRQRGNRR